MSRTTDAQDRFVTSQARWTDLPCVATIGTMVDVPAFIEATMFNDAYVPGGIAQRGSQVVRVKKSLLTDYANEPNGEPPKFTSTTVRGIDRVIMDVDERDGVFYITTGDPSGEDN